MSDVALLDLARAAGVVDEWVDVEGHHRRVGIDSLRHILEALGFLNATPSDLAESLHRLSQEAERLPRLITLRVDTRLALPAKFVQVDEVAELVDETGGVQSLRFVNRRERAFGPIMDRSGYYRLRLASGEVTVAVAPPCAVTLADRAAGRPMWGVAAQIYSLHRPGDGGVGDATAVRQLAESAAQHGADAVALSPVHSLFSADPARYGPYSPSSRLFLNPLFGDPVDLFGAERVARFLSPTTSDTQAASLVDWSQVAGAKLALLRSLFEDFRDRDLAADTSLARDFTAFVQNGGASLREHALFEALHAHWQTRSSGAWSEWPEGWRHPFDREVVAFAEKEAETIRFHQFLQWLAARSFSVTQEAARAAGMRIGLIADLAIGMDRNGSHAWARQDDILLGLTVGAPPDAFNPRGQDWGLAGFSPQALRANGFEPFLATLRACLRYSGGVRIDHVMGLLRLWLVPQGAMPSEGAYLSYPFEDLLRLVALESHRHGAVVIGEDLGTVPQGFRARMRRAGIAGMDVLWFQRSRSGFRSPQSWRPDAVAMTTTHDLPTAAGWWSGADIAVRRDLGLAADDEEARREVDRGRLWQSFARAGVAGRTPPPPGDTAPAVDAALAFVARSPSPLMIAPLEDLLGLADQPNLPGTIDEHPNWRRRLNLPAATLFESPDVRRRIDLIAAGRR
ncbi:4-alpha-glucanotransferase [Reyranella sp.]|uniref:4-alpha-glucanotransferase n=1 Tax=Reyranella sp. TaxID=1929291 RepID=UPI0011F6DB30|nr:4-alpha-glucanotransferase [Reyranella sp.]TAJ82362.1 MAG: 4-alpha-glucanotransferase [Reyranella sp.]